MERAEKEGSEFPSKKHEAYSYVTEERAGGKKPSMPNTLPDHWKMKDHIALTGGEKRSNKHPFSRKTPLVSKGEETAKLGGGPSTPRRGISVKPPTE